MSRQLPVVTMQPSNVLSACKSSTTFGARPYTYTPLPASSKNIRLLTLLPGAFDTDIKSELYETELGNGSPLYQALSYTWGSESDPAQIDIEGDKLPVTRNLACALQHLRYPDRTRTLWVDAVCVNQRDLDERSEQVPRMADIYKLAEYVVAWLGPEADGSALALRTLDTIGSMIVANLSTVTMKPSDKAGVAGQSHWADTTATMPFGPGDLDTVHHLVDRPWFERLWIQQEITLATEAILISGFDNITWTRFRTAIFCLNIKAPRQTEVFTKYDDAWERLKLIYRICYQYWKYPLIGQLNLTSRCKCSDPRDRIFGVLSISQFPTGLEIKADYKKSTVEVYQEVALQYYQRDLYMLTCCEFQNSMAGGPTWVPNWTIRNSAAEHLPWTRAGGSSNPLVEYMGGGLLQVIGMRVASIKSANLLGRLHTEIATAIRTYAPPTSKESLEILCQTLRCEMFGDWYYPPRISYQNYEESLEALKILLGNDPASPLTAQIQAQVQRYMFFAATYSMGRSIFWTNDGRLGLGPGLTQETDEIVVFIGCPALMILRPSGGGKYWVVGGCFIHDLMDSEALLGPPPEHYQRLKMVPQNEQEVFHEAYRNNLTGQFHDEDPRLAALPSRLRNDGVRQVYPTGFPKDGQEGDYMGYMTWTKGLLGVGEKVEIMRNDLQPFLLL